MDRLIELQKWLYGGVSGGIKSTVDLSGLPSHMGAAFVFGMVHALMPGHGKGILVSYHSGRPGQPIDGFITGTLLALTHIGTAAVLVLAGVAVISRSVSAGGRAPAFEAASATLIVLVGVFLAIRAIWPPPHAHASDGRVLAVVTGLVPCPLTTFILIYSITNNKLAVGIAAVGAMLGGVIVTISGFAIAAVLARERFLRFLEPTTVLRQRLGFWIELIGAAAIVAIGAAMIWKRIV